MEKPNYESVTGEVVEEVTMAEIGINLAEKEKGSEKG